MKKLLLLLLFCSVFAKTNAYITTTIYSGTGAGSYHTGYDYYGWWLYDNWIYAGYYDYYKGWAVFDLSSIPAGSTITSCVIGFNVITYPWGAYSWTTYGYAGDFSTIASGGSGASTIWSDITSGTVISTATYGSSYGPHTLASTTAGTGFIATNAGSKVSIGFTSPSSYSYYEMTGETGTASTTGSHRPYLQIEYCPPAPAILTATASPTILCAGGTLHLAATTATIDTGYSWVGPGYSATGRIDSFVTTTASAGVYTFITVDSNACTHTATTAVVTVNPTPVIAGVVSPICAYTHDTLHTTGRGHWTLSPYGLARLDTLHNSDTAVFTGTTYTAGTANLTFTIFATGCSSSTSINVKPFPAPIMNAPANDTICLGSTFIAHDTSYGDTGRWVSAVPAFASITFGGLVTALAPGTTIIQYHDTATGCGPAQITLTVVNIPSIISGMNHICVAAIDTLRDSVSGGIWTSSDPFIGTVATCQGWLTGYNAGNATITYTLPGNCYKTFPVLVTSAPGLILNLNPACPGNTFTVNDTMALGRWHSSDSTVASITPVDSVTGRITALTAGTTIITYASCGYNMTGTLVVNPIPHPIQGRDSVCLGDTVLLYDSTNMGIWVSKYDTVATAAAAFGIITGMSNGIDTIFYQLPTGCKAKMHFYVNPLPAATTGGTGLCANSFTNLSDPTIGGKWYSMDTSIAKADATGMISGVSPGLDTIIYKAETGCIVKTPITVNPLPAPIVSVDTAICAKDSMRVSDASHGGVWSTNNSSVFSVDTNGELHSVSTLGSMAHVIYTLPATGCSRYLNILVHPAPIPTVRYDAAIGEDSVLNAYYFNGTKWVNNYISYQWYDSSTVGPIPGATSNFCAILYPDEVYYVLVQDTLGCYGKSGSFYGATAGVKTIGNDRKIVVYPNPATDNIHILSAVPVQAIITSVDGKLMLDMKNAANIDISKYAAGSYFISLFDENGVLLKSEEFTKK